MTSWCGPLPTSEPHVCAPVDANGNLTADGTRTFEWDARNQLLAADVGTHRSEFSYDGDRRRVRIVEKENSVVQSDTKMIWCDDQTCEERATDGTTVTRRALSLSEQVGGGARFLTIDHLGSVAEVSNDANAVLARYAFDPWGRRTVSAGSDVSAIGYTGHRGHAPSGLSLTLHRGYDSEIGRWASEDPIGQQGDGPNLFAYVLNRPIVRFDPLGLRAIIFPGTPFFTVCAAYHGANVFFRHRRGTEDDRYNHCLASCMIAKHCGQDMAKTAEAGKEDLDFLQCKVFGRSASCGSAYQPQDYEDNQRGRDAAKACQSVNCEMACWDLRGKGQGPPGPYTR